jgi:hypothetical protein
MTARWMHVCEASARSTGRSLVGLAEEFHRYHVAYSYAIRLL